MKTLYLDTSVINKLFDDSRASLLKNVIHKNFIVYPSIFIIVELASETNEKRRLGLIKLIKDLSNNYLPAAMPGDLLRRSLESVNVNKKNMDHSLDHKGQDILNVLNNPSLINEGAYQKIISWKKNQEEWYQDILEDWRPKMQEAIKKLPKSEKNIIISSFSKMLRNIPSDGKFINYFVSDLSSHTGTNININKELIQKLINYSEHWRFFLSSMAYGLYVRSIKVNYFSRNRNPGNIDTQQSIYLTICDVFVTGDKQQYRMLRSVNQFGHKKRQIWNYNYFINYLNNIITANKALDAAARIKTLAPVSFIVRRLKVFKMI